MKDKDKYFVETENLAFPEIHTGKVKQISSEKPNADKICYFYNYSGLVEIHKKKKKSLQQIITKANALICAAHFMISL